MHTNKYRPELSDLNICLYRLSTFPIITFCAGNQLDIAHLDPFFVQKANMDIAMRLLQDRAIIFNVIFVGEECGQPINMGDRANLNKRHQFRVQ